MSAEQLNYIEQHWGGLPAFLETYIPLDRQLRQQFSSQGDDNALLDNMRASVLGIVSNATNAINARLSTLQDYVSSNLNQATFDQLRKIMPGGDDFEDALRRALKSQLRGINDSSQEQFLQALVAKLKTTDNDSLLDRFNTVTQSIVMNGGEVSSFRSEVAKLKDQLSEHGRTVQQLQEPIKSINQQVTVHKRGKGVEIGQEAELRFQMELQRTFRHHEVDHVSGIGHRTDFRLSKTGKPDIMFELKDHKTNIKTDSVFRVENDAHNLCRHTVLVSMRSGVVDRKDFEFRVKDNRYVVLFLSNVEWDMTRVKAAVNLIYSIEDLLRAGDADGNILFTPETVAAIAEDLSQFESKIK